MHVCAFLSPCLLHNSGFTEVILRGWFVHNKSYSRVEVDAKNEYEEESDEGIFMYVCVSLFLFLLLLLLRWIQRKAF